MPTKQYQSSFLTYDTHVLKLEDANIEYQPDFIDNESASELYQQLFEKTSWDQDTVVVYGKAHLTPRLSYWVGEDWMDYRYSNHTMKAHPWNPLLLDIKRLIEEKTGDSFNSVLVNYYRDGRDSNGWHSDDEPELGKNPIIASLSLGAARDFHLRHKKRKDLKHKMRLEHGSLLMMRGETQHYWQHQIPKRAHANGRINLTFRTLKRISN